MTSPPTDKTDRTDKTPVMLNEWGIPNWQNPADYGDPYGQLNPDAKWSSNRWRWEFFRRRKDLRDCFDRGARRTELYYE